MGERSSSENSDTVHARDQIAGVKFMGINAGGIFSDFRLHFCDVASERKADQKSRVRWSQVYVDLRVVCLDHAHRLRIKQSHVGDEQP
jgi:hypothetical protein